MALTKRGYTRTVLVNRTDATRKVMRVFKDKQEHYPYELAKGRGRPHVAVISQMCNRLEKRGFLTSRLEVTDGHKVRRIYKATDEFIKLQRHLGI